MLILRGKKARQEYIICWSLKAQNIYLPAANYKDCASQQCVNENGSLGKVIDNAGSVDTNSFFIPLLMNSH